MKIALEPFARSCIEASFGEDLPAGAQAAIRHYARRLRSQRQPAELPSFRRGPGAEPAPEVEFELAVPAEVEAMLSAEARRQEASVGQIVTHAVFVYFADLEAAEGEAKEDAAAPRYRVHAIPRTQAAAARRGALAPAPRGRGCNGARAGGGSGLGTS